MAEQGIENEGTRVEERLSLLRLAEQIQGLREDFTRVRADRPNEDTIGDFQRRFHAANQEMIAYYLLDLVQEQREKMAGLEQRLEKLTGEIRSLRMVARTGGLGRRMGYY